MSAAAPWSVKGIDPKAREVAKDLARREGMTLGEWLNSRIMVEGGESDYVPSSKDHPNDRRTARRADDYEATRESAQRLNTLVSELGERLEAAERRSATAIQGVDQAVASIVRRLDMDRDDEARQGRRLEDISREMREGHLRLQRLEASANDAQNSVQSSGALQERLDRAQEATRSALKDLERSFAVLDQRIGVGSGVDADSLAKLAETLTQQIEANRLEMMRRIDAATDNRRIARVEQALTQLTNHTKAAELRSASAVEAMGQQVMNIARNMHGRMQAVEDRGNDAEALTAALDQRLLEVGRTLDEKLDREIARHSASVDARMTRQEDDNALALERLGGEITRISDRLSERITQTERRSSQAIDDIGRRLSESTEKFERRHEDASGELAERVRQSEERTRQLLEEAKEARAQRESAALNAAPRLTASLPPADDLDFAPMPHSASGLPPTDSLFGSDAGEWSTREVLDSDWRATAFGSTRNMPLPEAQAMAGWADTVASEMAVDPFPTNDSLRPFGSLDADLGEALDDDFALLEADGEQAAPAYADEFPSIFASTSEEKTSSLDAKGEGDLDVSDPLSMTFDARVEEDNRDYNPLAAPLSVEADTDTVSEDVDPFTLPLTSASTTQEAIDSARAAITDEEPGVAVRSTFGLKKNRKGGKSQLQEKLDRKASRDGSTFGNALKASALAMLVVGGGGYATLKLAKDQNLNLNFGTTAVPGKDPAPIAALALEGTPTEAVPSAEVAATEGAAIYNRAMGLLDAGDPSGLEPLQRAADLGYVPAQMRLASLYTDGGPGVDVSLIDAREWTRRAAEGGDPRAMQHYATQLYDGVGGTSDEAAALEWMRKSAEAGRVDAQYNLAHLYETGIKGMRPDKVEAFTWYMIAGRRGDQQALESVQRLTSSLQPAERKRAIDGADAFNVQPVG